MLLVLHRWNRHAYLLQLAICRFDISFTWGGIILTWCNMFCINWIVVVQLQVLFVHCVMTARLTNSSRR